jgi:tetratricopeptide (TPR) repeat protein
LFVQLQPLETMASAQHQLGQLAMRRGQFEQARAMTRKALGNWAKYGDQAEVANQYYQLGSIAKLSGELDRAQERHTEVLAVRERIGEPSAMARSYHELGLVTQARGQFEEADAWYALHWPSGRN